MSRPLLAVAFAIAALALPGVPARAAAADAATLKPVAAFVAGLNAGNSATVAAAYAGDVVIIDEFAPFRWSGEKAANTWWADFGAFATKVKMSNPHIVAGKPAFLSYNDAKTSAYVVMPMTFTYTTKGKKQTEIGRWAVVLTKTADGWRISSSAWATVSDTGP